MGEMSAIFARRRKASDNPAAKKEDTPKFSEPGEIDGKSKEKYATIPRPKSLSSNQKNSSPSSSANPSSNSATSPGSSMMVGKNNSDGTGNYIEGIKQEIIEEVKKELQKVKEEIIAALMQELKKVED
ncbi:vasodilator-stimulated phosphoprotein-like isoform X2 [Pseudochaenichthys georgianus]|uniref:vasodilator-stimulated phosphoprotein-like isoform X2 n=1 Tax=Pseudochaenichthys georgianus TaxID=52239 RepID=UPI00146E9D41|nr:vasodilator-stimulated phosphoprotein-like isoform X2 [Pseudochaenichthys georgianus]